MCCFDYVRHAAAAHLIRSSQEWTCTACSPIEVRTGTEEPGIGSICHRTRDACRKGRAALRDRTTAAIDLRGRVVRRDASVRLHLRFFLRHLGMCEYAWDNLPANFFLLRIMKTLVHIYMWTQPHENTHLIQLFYGYVQKIKIKSVNLETDEVIMNVSLPTNMSRTTTYAVKLRFQHMGYLKKSKENNKISGELH